MICEDRVTVLHCFIYPLFSTHAKLAFSYVCGKVFIHTTTTPRNLQRELSLQLY